MVYVHVFVDCSYLRDIYIVLKTIYEKYISRLFEFHHLGLQVVAIEVFLDEEIRICNASTRSNQCPRLKANVEAQIQVGW